MNNRAAAARYAQALFDITSSDARSALDGELTATAQLFLGRPELSAVLSSPSVSTVTKRAVVQRLATRGKASEPMTKLLTLMAERDRVGIIGDVAAVFHELVLEDQRILQAEVTTATPLTDEERHALQSRLSVATTRQVRVTTRVAPEIIGGIVTKIGSTVYDGSLSSQLGRVRARLAADR